MVERLHDTKYIPGFVTHPITPHSAKTCLIKMKDGLVPIRLEMSHEALHDMLGGAPVSSVE